MRHVIFWNVFAWLKKNILWITFLYAAVCAALILMQGDGQ